MAVIELLKSLSKTPQNLVIINQTMRSVTSMGANDQEADGASSRKDFLHCYTLVRKEGKETVFWLRLIRSTNSGQILPEKTSELITEGSEIVAIVSSIINRTASINRK
ncbi:four helix bundle protein [Candidatus Microgenomates bacterium]|nr:four helix bundle protein [Candidatus Microgenomates bacterium]